MRKYPLLYGIKPNQVSKDLPITPFARTYLLPARAWLLVYAICFSCGSYVTQNGYAQVFCGKSFVQVFCNSGNQYWIDTSQNVKIRFTSLPTDPVVGNTTQLKFSVEHLKSGTPLNNLTAKITILNSLPGQPSSIQTGNEGNFSTISNVLAPHGTFSINYGFSQAGMHQIIIRVNSNDNNNNNNSSRPSNIDGIAALASFNLLVSLY